MSRTDPLAARPTLMVVAGILVSFVAIAAAAPCGSVVTFADGVTPTNELHVATTGSDTSGDGSASSPYATIRKAAMSAAPGTGVVVHAGTYAGGMFIYDLHGTPAAPIWIGGAASEARPVIEGGGEGLHFIDARYVVVHDLEVRLAANNGINADDGGDYDNPLASHHLVFRNVSIHDIGGTGNQDGLKLSGINDFAVLDSSFARCGGASSGSGIDHVGCHRGVIARCTFEELSANAVQIKGGSAELEVRNCWIRDAGERGVNIGGSTGFEYFRPPLSTTEPNVEARDIRIVGNVFEGSRAAVAFVGAVDCIAANNTIVDPGRWVLRILQETTTSGAYVFLPCGDNTFANNLVYVNDAALSTHVNIGPNTDAASFTFANNLWYMYDNPSASTPSLPAPESNGIYGIDPALADPAAHDYRIGADSPAAGMGMTPAGVDSDVRGVCFATPPSIGAYEVETASGDYDGDGDVDLADFGVFLTCFNGPQRPPAGPTCDAADADRDVDVDLADFAAFLACFNGPDRPPACD